MSAQRLSSLPRWKRLNADGQQTGRCLASTKALAERALPCGRGEYVVSYDSAALGMPKSLPRHKCHSCGVRDAEPGKSDCARCVLVRRAANSQRDRDEATRPRNYAGERRRMRSSRSDLPDGLLASMRRELDGALAVRHKGAKSALVKSLPHVSREE